ncbi:MAG TPA: hypothetical protein VFO05_04905 [Candidatus Limnocylindrales bacterium]|nr:hypothetical protein [Candidatus Limnocylindrales bacterium]
MRRALTAGLWFFAFFCVHELAWSFLGSPRLLGVAVGAAAAAFILIDPVKLIRAERPTASPVQGSAVRVQQP